MVSRDGLVDHPEWYIDQKIADVASEDGHNWVGGLKHGVAALQGGRGNDRGWRRAVWDGGPAANSA